MALLNEVDLKLLITAEDKASTPVKALIEVVNNLKTALTDMAGLAPFTGIVDSAQKATQSVQDLRDTVMGLADLQVNPFGQWPEQANAAASEASYAFFKSFADLQLPSPFGNLITSAQDVSGQIVETFDNSFKLIDTNAILQPMVTSASEVVDSLGTVKEYVVEIDSAVAANPLNTWVASAQDLRTALEGAQSSLTAMGGLSGLQKAPGGRTGSLLDRLNSGLNHIGTGVMYGGMNLMMGYYGLQMLAGGAGNFANIQRIAQINNQTPNEAAQTYAMLASVGMTGSAGASFLSQLSGNLQKTLTPDVGTGLLSKSAILLQSLGITQADIGTSPWELLNTIGQRYRGLLAEGRGSQATELLNLTGTSSVANLLGNWSAVSKETSGINLGMTPSQLHAAVGKSLSLQGSLQELGIAFDTLSVQMVPAVSAITKALTDLANGLSGKTGLVTTLQNITSALGPFGTAIASAVVAIKGLAAVKGVVKTAQTVKSGVTALPVTVGGSTMSALRSLITLDPALLPGEINQILGPPPGWKGQWDPTGLNSGGPLLPTPSWWPALHSGLDQAAGDIQKWANSLWPAAQSGFSAATAGITKWATGTWHSIAGGLSETWHHLTEWATGTWGWLSRGWASLPKDVTSWAQGLWGWFHSGLSNFASGLDTWARGLWGSVASSFSDFITNLVTWAKEIVPNFLHSVGLGPAPTVPHTAVSGAVSASVTAKTGAQAAAALLSANPIAPSSAPIWVNHQEYANWGAYHAAIAAKSSPIVTNHVQITVNGPSDPLAAAKQTAALFSQRMSNMMQFP